MKHLVFVHGFMGGGDQWASQEPLSEVRRLVRLDLPGFGRNAHLEPIGSIEGFAVWALGHLSEIGVDRFDLIGHSMGGMIVQEMVRLAPERVERLILYATGARGILPGRFEPIETSMKRAEEDGATATARRISATWFLEREAAPAYSDCAAIAEKSGLGAILAGLAAMRDWSGEAELRNIPIETLVLWGDRDRTYDWSQIELLWKSIPKSHLAVVPDCAHAVHMERPWLFNRIVSDFLEGACTGE